MRILRKLIDKYRRVKDPISYARMRGVTLGERCKLLSTNFGTEPWLITLGDHVLISGDVTFFTHDGSTWVIREYPEYENVVKFGAITVGNNCFIGYGAKILPGVTIGDNCIIGAGSIVAKDVPSDTVVAGVPARAICSTWEYADKCKANMPEYDLEAYRKDFKGEVLRVWGRK